MILTRPDNLKAEQHDLLARLTAACPEMTQLVAVVGDFAQLLTPCAGNADAFSRWIVQVRAVDLPHLHAFTRGLERDRDPVIAALTLPYSNGPTEGVTTKSKRIARQMTDEQVSPPLRHRILLGIAARSVTTECKTGPSIGHSRTRRPRSKNSANW
jgi:transposase